MALQKPCLPYEACPGLTTGAKKRHGWLRAGHSLQDKVWTRQVQQPQQWVLFIAWPRKKAFLSPRWFFLSRLPLVNGQLMAEPCKRYFWLPFIGPRRKQWIRALGLAELLTELMCWRSRNCLDEDKQAGWPTLPCDLLPTKVLHWVQGERFLSGLSLLKGVSITNTRVCLLSSGFSWWFWGTRTSRHRWEPSKLIAFSLLSFYCSRHRTVLHHTS